MPLAAEDFNGFDAPASARYLRSFDARTRQRGEHYFRAGLVTSLACVQPGCHYTAEVIGGEKYGVSLTYEDGWDSECTCPMGVECKHAYAALKQLLADYSSASVDSLSATAGKISN